MGAWFVAQTGFEGPTDSLSIGHEQQVFLPHLESHAARSTLRDCAHGGDRANITLEDLGHGELVDGL